MPEPLLSIVIPTRNRLDCAANVARGLSESPEPDFEAIIHDNSSDAQLGALIEELGDPRIRYFHVAEPLNMHANFDRAIGHATGRYVCALGDDDGVIVSEALKVLARAEQVDADAVLTAVPSYSWPGLRHWFWGDVGGRLVNMDVPSDAGETLLDPVEELERVFRQGMTAGLGQMPRVYQGFVRRRSLDALHAQCGTYFPGASPDMANAVGLVPFVNKILTSRSPTVIAGHSPGSGGGAGSAGRHHGRLEDQAHLPPGTLESWNDAVPRFWSGMTIYAQSAIVARRATGQEVPPIGFHRLYAACLVYERRHYWRDVITALRRRPRGRSATALRTGLTAAGLLAVRGRTFVGNFLHHRLRGGGGERYRDMAEVMRECERRVSAADRTPIRARSGGTARVAT